jgi:hypothetical protein
MSPVEVTHDWWDSKIRSRQFQGVPSDNVETRKPDSRLMFASLGDHVGENVEVRQEGVETES